MSDTQWDGYENDDDDDSPLLKDLRKQLRARDKRIGELEKEVSSFKTQTRSTTVADLVAKAGYAKGVAGFVPDSVDSTEDAVNKWLQDNGALFAKAQAENTGDAPGSNENQDPNGGSTVPAEEQRQMDVINGADSGAPSTGRDRELLAKLQDPALTMEALDALVQGG